MCLCLPHPIPRAHPHRKVQPGWGSHLLPSCQRVQETRAVGLEGGPWEQCKSHTLLPSLRIFPEHLCSALTHPSCPLPQEIQAYRQRSLMEKELLFFSYDVFGIPFVDPVSGIRPGWSWQSGVCLQGKGLSSLCLSWILVQLLLLLLLWLQDTWTPEEVIPKRLREKQK